MKLPFILIMTFWSIGKHPVVAWTQVRSPAQCVTLAGEALVASKRDGIPRMGFTCRPLRKRVPAACVLSPERECS